MIGDFYKGLNIMVDSSKGQGTPAGEYIDENYYAHY